MSNFDEFRQAGHRAVDAIADYLESVSDRPVSPDVDRDLMTDVYSGTISDQGVGIEGAVDEFAERVFDQSLAMSNPLYLGLVNSSPLPAAAIGDLFVSTIDNNAGAFHQGPTNAATEKEVLRALGEKLGYCAEGLILPGGSYVNFHALHLARTHHLPDWPEAPVEGRQPKVYISDVSHFCNDRAILALGLGKQAIARVPVTGRGEMDMASLQQQVEADLEAGDQPFAVVVTVGTTGTGAIDDVARAAEIAKQFGLWLHVDACYGGAIGLLPEWSERFKAISQADSLGVDLHKWFFMPLTAGVVLSPHVDATMASFDIGASYIPDQGYVEAYRRGLPTSRRGTSIAIWLALRAYGWETIRTAVRRNIELTKLLEQKLAAIGLRVLSGGELSIACARWEPGHISTDQWDALQVKLADSVRATGRAWFATTQHEGQTWLRFNMVNLNTRAEHLDSLVATIEGCLDSP